MATPEKVTRITELASALTDTVEREQIQDYTTVFNALSQVTVAFLIDYLITSGKGVDESTLADQLQRFSALQVAQAEYILNVSGVQALAEQSPTEKENL